MSLIAISLSINAIAQGTNCSNASPFCTGTIYTYPASTNVPSLGTVGCLYSTPNPAWYWMQIGNSGNININIASGGDVDFICWGPFTSLAAACATNLMSMPGIACSFSTAASENCYLPNTVSGQVYVLLITNYANIVTNITFSKTSGTGTTNCGIVAPPITNNGPLCVGQTLQLSVTNPISGASYSWTGPNGFSSSNMNPSIPNATAANSGIYSMTITIGNQTSPPVTTAVVINTNPIITTAASSTNICSGTTTSLNALSNLGSTTFIWLPGSLSGTSVNVTPLSSTTYTVTGTASGCTGTNSITITVNPKPILIPSAIPNTICNGQSASLDVSSNLPGTTYIWMPGSFTGNPISVTPSTTTTYTIIGTSIGCTGSSTLTVTVNPVPILSISATPDTICEGDSSLLSVVSAVPGTSYTWIPGTLTGSSVSVAPITSTSYTLIANALGCTESNLISLTVNPNPIITLFANPSNICQGKSSTIIANSSLLNSNISWMPGSLSGTSISVSPSVTTIYSVLGTATGCSGSNTITLTVHPQVTATTTQTDILCNGDNNGSASVQVITGMPPYIYNWSDGSSQNTISGLSANNYTITITDAYGCDSIYYFTITQPPALTLNLNPINQNCFNSCDGMITSFVNGGTGIKTYNWSNGKTSPDITSLCTGNYSLTVTDSNGCTITNSSFISTSSFIESNFNTDLTSGVLPLTVNFYFSGTGANSYLWDFDDGSFSTDQNPEHIFNNPGTYFVTLTVNSGVPTNCSDSFSLAITVFPQASIIIPNVFTPNGDGSNDRFIFKTEGLESFICNIYDRWGKKIYYFTDATEGWDGQTITGGLSAAGVYYYIISAKGLDNKPLEMQGTVTLIR